MDAKKELLKLTKSCVRLSAATKGIINTHLTPSRETWYNKLQTEIILAQKTARNFQTKLSAQTIIDCLNHNSGQLLSLLDQYQLMLSSFKTEVTDIVLKAQKIIFSEQAKITNQKQINKLNQVIDNLKNKLNSELSNLFKYDSSESMQYIEIVLGVLFSSYTRNRSLLLTGFGLAINETNKHKISDIESIFALHQNKLEQYLVNIPKESQHIATLNTLLLPISLLLININDAKISLESIKKNLSTLNFNTVKINKLSLKYYKKTLEGCFAHV